MRVNTSFLKYYICICLLLCYSEKNVRFFFFKNPPLVSVFYFQNKVWFTWRGNILISLPSTWQTCGLNLLIMSLTEYSVWMYVIPWQIFIQCIIIFSLVTSLTCTSGGKKLNINLLTWISALMSLTTGCWLEEELIICSTVNSYRKGSICHHNAFLLAA